MTFDPFEFEAGGWPRRLRHSALLLPAALVLGFGPVVAFSQSQAEDSDVDGAAIEEVIVTGSRIVGRNESSPSPVAVVSSADIQAVGTIRMEDLLNDLPQVSPSETSGKANEATGTATIDLRGLGAERTLVLVNGRRLPFGSPIAAAADVNQVPAQLVERVDVLTGGATAVYGADAVAGVVNFILKDNFEGVQVDFQAGAFQSANDDSSIEAVLREFNQPVPGSAFDGESYTLNVMMGANLGDGRGNVTGYFTYRKQEEVLQGERISSACAFGSRNGGNEFTCAGSGTTNPAQFANSAPVAVPFQVTLADDGTLRDYVFPDDTYNFAPVNNYIQPNERYAFGAIGHYDITDRVTAYTEFGFSDNRIVDQIAPTGIFFGQTDTINCDNPLLSAEQVQVFCTNNGFGPDEDAPLNIGRRNVEGGGRRNAIRHTSYRAVGGIRGDLSETWAYDVSAQYADVQYSDQADNFFNLARVVNALEVRIDPATGQPACQVAIDGTDPSCVPYDPFGIGTVTQAALDYMAAPGFREGGVTQTIFTGTVTGELDRYGIRSPFAEEGVVAVFGLEYREETLEQTNDFLVRTGALGNPRADVSGDIAVREAFAEFQVPLVQGARLAQDLSFTGAYRYSDFYRTTGDQNTFAAGLSWSPTDDVRFRAQFQRATRSPNPIELFSPQNRFEFNLPELPNGAFDPCGGPEPFRTLEECARTGVTAEQYGQIISLGGQFNNLTGGNEDLEVETSDTVTVGVVLTPAFIDGLTLSIDYFDITVDDFIGTVPEQISLNNCLDTGDPFFCSLIVRDPVNGRLSGNENAYVIATNVNTGSLKTTGFDVLATYEFETDRFGSFRVDYTGTILDSLEKVPLPGEPAFECAGFFSPTRAQCGVSSPEYRHRIPITWYTPWNEVSAQLVWRYFGEVDQFGTSGNTLISHLDAVNYFDASVRATVLDFVDLRIGINNLFDEQPPVSNQVGGAGGSFGTGNTFPGVYDALGRFMFVGTTVTF
jgi:outer membrane receptor protein involved in Fe transport